MELGWALLGIELDLLFLKWAVDWTDEVMSAAISDLPLPAVATWTARFSEVENNLYEGFTGLIWIPLCGSGDFSANVERIINGTANIPKIRVDAQNTHAR
jgi:hypothetical protein